MLSLILSHLLAVWLLLSLHAREIPAEENEVVKACGREYVRLRIQICGSISWSKRNRQQRGLGQAPSALSELVSSSSSASGTETLNGKLESIPDLPQELKATLSEKELSFRELQPALENSDLNLEVSENSILGRQNEAADQSLSRLGSSRLNAHSRKKRWDYIRYSDKCCHMGCTRKELHELC
ncbi:prorelaxin-like [Suricata suricatta]|uniref:Insulin-like domain-containing protein n=1 Tax=Suricata suricatta TaxID=37032 RepID=A0A673VE33_SURSU|nr:prorelaxin-like [Suricata suricatta]